ncbi:hypothetical protein BKK54_11265 [Rodentibacter genomosp. 1]|uniref:Uncharacterized protein n=1 Tax=Rodentibacter genomosp. 1 TaxID=1908264 RepID=A0A1V3IZU0_9PAST|nr:hypothetical protein [Rodentibacter genomosp. 1]OOF48000.1 hypothetical protein BKK54_11265 [Rodentibacter genomosp. 1]
MVGIKDKILKVRETKSENGFGFFYIQRTDEDKKSLTLVGNAGVNDLDSVIYGYSVGFESLYSQFLPRIIDWLNEGISNKESAGEVNFHQCLLTSSIAFAYWINTGKNNVSLWKNAVYWQEQWNLNLDYSVPLGKEEKEEFAIDLLRYIQAKEYDKAIKHYEFVTKGKLFKFSTRLTGYNLAYAYCLHFSEGKYSVDELDKAGKGFLEKHLQMLYIQGRSVEMLYWLKTICDAREKEYTPEEVIYTFYEFVKDEDKPDFVKALLKRK